MADPRLRPVARLPISTGIERTRAEHLLNGPLKWAAAYKMQLFMNLKMSGAEHLNTLNLWAGMDGSMGV